MLDQYDRLNKRKAFMGIYKKEKMFEDSLEEFDLARYALSDLSSNATLVDFSILGPLVKM